jgi:enamine deaminase RidA (YjgF/YER057c/UK114 family)
MISTRRHIGTNSVLESEYGYCRAVVQDPFVFISGTAGYDHSTMEMPDDVTQQTFNSWETIAATLSHADSDLSEIVRATVYITETVHAATVLHVCAQMLENVRPASSIVIVKGFVRPEIKVLIEATAMWRVKTGPR